MKIKYIILLLLAFAMAGCTLKKGDAGQRRQENFAAKRMLQGIWINEEEEDVAFRAKGDTIYYPDTTSQAVRFQIYGDTLVLEGANVMKYVIVKQSQHLFQFKNQGGDLVSLVRSEDPTNIRLFEHRRSIALNQNQLIKRDTVVAMGKDKYHCYVQVNPTTYKVVKATYNDEGVEVGNVYFDNIIHLSVYKGAIKVFSKDFHKKDFTRYVPSAFLNQSILSDMIFNKIDSKGIHYSASICIPDSQSSYMIDVVVSKDGKTVMQIAN
jgi:hypothetical protein